MGYYFLYISNNGTCENKSGLVDFHVSSLEGMSIKLKYKLESTNRDPGEFHLNGHNWYQRFPSQSSRNHGTERLHSGNAHS